MEELTAVRELLRRVIESVSVPRRMQHIRNLQATVPFIFAEA